MSESPSPAGHVPTAEVQPELIHISNTNQTHLEFIGERESAGKPCLVQKTPTYGFLPCFAKINRSEPHRCPISTHLTLLKRSTVSSIAGSVSSRASQQMAGASKRMLIVCFTQTGKNVPVMRIGKTNYEYSLGFFILIGVIRVIRVINQKAEEI